MLTHNACIVAGESGSFADLSKRGVVGDGLTPHHMPQAAQNFTSYSEGEHVLTRTFGSAGRVTAQVERGLPFRTVLQRDIQDIRNLAGSKYNQGMINLIKYYKDNFPNLMAKTK